MSAVPLTPGSALNTRPNDKSVPQLYMNLILTYISFITDPVDGVVDTRQRNHYFILFHLRLENCRNFLFFL